MTIGTNQGFATTPQIHASSGGAQFPDLKSLWKLDFLETTQNTTAKDKKIILHYMSVMGLHKVQIHPTNKLAYQGFQ